jgi:citrate synthase
MNPSKPESLAFVNGTPDAQTATHAQPNGKAATQPIPPVGVRSALTVTDNRTDRSYEIPVEDGAIRTPVLRQVKAGPDDFGLLGYDPSFANTAACKSAITYIDGDRGILLYRGYPVEQLAEHSTYLETAYLLIHGELPTAQQLNTWIADVMHRTWLHENLKRVLDGFSYDAHPMGMLHSTVAALSTFYPDAKRWNDAEQRSMSTIRLIAKMPTIAAFAYRHSRGLPYVYPDLEQSFAGNFLAMLFKLGDSRYQPNPVLERALEVLFILHADHEQNASTSAVRAVGSTHTDPYTAVAAGIGALSGPLHGGANEAVIHMLREIGSKEHVPAFIKQVQAGDRLLMGFGHRVYKSYDPRAKIVKRTADAVFELVGHNPLLDLALELERIALEDDYFVTRKLYPNVDFYSGLIYDALKMPTNMYTSLFAIPRTAGWCAQWLEGTQDEEQKIWRPRQLYTGAPRRDFVQLRQRNHQS